MLVLGIFLAIVLYVTRGPSKAKRVSSHPIQLGVPFQLVLTPADTGRHALWLEGEVHFDGDEVYHYRLDFEVSYDDQPVQKGPVGTVRGSGQLRSQYNRAVASGTWHLSFLRPRPAGATIRVAGVLMASESVTSAKLALLFTRW